MKDIVSDKWGNKIYLTDERWQHIITRHPDMAGQRQHLLLTIQAGQRREVAIGSNKYEYWKKFRHLHPGKTRIRVIVQFETKKSGTSLLPNHFVVTAYQI